MDNSALWNVFQSVTIKGCQSSPDTPSFSPCFLCLSARSTIKYRPNKGSLFWIFRPIWTVKPNIKHLWKWLQSDNQGWHSVVCILNWYYVFFRHLLVLFMKKVVAVVSSKSFTLDTVDFNTDKISWWKKCVSFFCLWLLFLNTLNLILQIEYIKFYVYTFFTHAVKGHKYLRLH